MQIIFVQLYSNRINSVDITMVVTIHGHIHCTLLKIQFIINICIEALWLNTGNTVAKWQRLSGERISFWKLCPFVNFYFMEHPLRKILVIMKFFAKKA